MATGACPALRLGALTPVLYERDVFLARSVINSG